MIVSKFQKSRKTGFLKLYSTKLILKEMELFKLELSKKRITKTEYKKRYNELFIHLMAVSYFQAFKESLKKKSNYKYIIKSLGHLILNPVKCRMNAINMYRVYRRMKSNYPYTFLTFKKDIVYDVLPEYTYHFRGLNSKQPEVYEESYTILKNAVRQRFFDYCDLIRVVKKYYKDKQRPFTFYPYEVTDPLKN